MLTVIDEQDTIENKSTHRVEVVALSLEKHPGADLLSIHRHDGWVCVTQTAQWEGKDRAAFVQPDTLVPVDHPAFTFLAADAKDGYARIRAKKIRQVKSFGLLVPVPEGTQIGDDVAGALGCKHYEPVMRGGHKSLGGITMGGEVASPPDVPHVKYDVEPGRKYAKRVFEPGEPVVVTEKLHGANARYVFKDGVMHCGSRTEWKKEYPTTDHITVESVLAMLTAGEEKRAKNPDYVPLPADELLTKAEHAVARAKAKAAQKNMWWQALDATPALRAFCEANPAVVVYGEVYGAVQDLSYGCQKGEVKFAAFDMLYEGRWLDADEFHETCCQHQVPTVPLYNPFAVCDLANGFIRTVAVEPIPFDFDTICEMAEGKTKVPGASHVREGVAVRPFKEREHDSCGRVSLKFVGAGYLDRKVVEPIEEEELV